MKKCILHIGRHKSGTSSLQKMLHENRALLKDKGWVYNTEHKRKIAQHFIAGYLNPRQMNRKTDAQKKQIKDKFDAYWANAEGYDQLIISSENFQNNKPVELQDTFGNFDLEIVAYVRSAVSYLLSAYAQLIKAKRATVTLEDYERTVFSANYNKFFSKWTAQFPNAKIEAGFFDRSSLVGGDVRVDFLARTSVGKDVDVNDLTLKKGDGNPSIGGQLLTFKRLLNAHDYTEILPSKHVYRAMQKMATNYAEYGPNRTISAALFEQLVDKYTADLKQFSQGHGIAFDKLLDESAVDEKKSVEEPVDFDLLGDRLQAYLPDHAQQLVALAKRSLIDT